LIGELGVGKTVCACFVAETSPETAEQQNWWTE